MIEVTSRDHTITVTGHAGCGPPGYDLCCAAASTLVETLVSALEDLTDNRITYEIQPGRAVIQYKELSAQGRVLVDGFFVGIAGVAGAYPDCVRVI